MRGIDDEDLTDMVNTVSKMMGMVAAHSDMCANYARICKKVYDELVAVGFEPDQAIRLVSGMSGTISAKT